MIAKAETAVINLLAFGLEVILGAADAFTAWRKRHR